MLFTLENERIRATVSSFGGHIEELYDKQDRQHHYWNYDSALWPRRTSVCFPICGSLPQERYTYQGKEYSLPMHGFLREREFSLVHADSNQVTLELCSDADSLRVFPFSFRFRLEYRLQADALLISYHIFNPSTDSPLLFSVGSHYTYRRPEQDCILEIAQVPGAVRRFVREGLLAKEATPFQDTRLEISRLLDGGSFILEFPEGSTPLLSLQSREPGFCTQVSFSGFSHCVFWAPSHDSPFFCMEPWAGIQNPEGSGSALEEKKAVCHLPPSSSREFQITIAI